MTRMPTPVASVAGRGAYAPPRHPAPIDLDLAGNEGATPPLALIDVLRSAGVDVLRRYPKAPTQHLTRALAERHGVTEDRVLVTAGADEAIDRICRAYLDEAREVVLPVPTFEMFEPYIGLTGAKTIEVDWPSGALPTEAMLDAIDEQTSLVVVVTPNNPTGAVATAEDLRRLATQAPHALVLVDCAYAEFADHDLTAAALALPNAVVCRSLSKAWGLAGLRIGYALGQPDTIAALRAAGGPFSVAGPSAAMGLAALDIGQAELRNYVDRVRLERASLLATGRRLGLAPTPSQGNFVLLRSSRAEWVRDALAGQGIAVRIWPGRSRLEDAIRIACPGRDDAMQRIERALAAALRPRRLLLCEAAFRSMAAKDSLLASLRNRLEVLQLTDAGPADAEPTWCVCDTAQHVEEARAQSMVPLGFQSTDDPDARVSAGVARLLDSPDQLLELLP